MLQRTWSWSWQQQGHVSGVINVLTGVAVQILKPKNDHMIFFSDLYIFFLCLLGIKKHSRNTRIIPCLNPSTFKRISSFDLKEDTSFGKSPSHPKNKRLGSVLNVAKMKFWDLFQKCDIGTDKNWTKIRLDSHQREFNTRIEPSVRGESDIQPQKLVSSRIAFNSKKRPLVLRL